MRDIDCVAGNLPKWAICGIDPTTGYIGFLKEYDLKADLEGGEASNFKIPLWETREEAQAFYDAHNVEGVFADGYKVAHIDDVMEEIIAKKNGNGFRRAIWALVAALLVSSGVELLSILVKFLVV